jgi:hypothetical protein
VTAAAAAAMLVGSRLMRFSLCSELKRVAQRVCWVVQDATEAVHEWCLNSNKFGVVRLLMLAECSAG